MEPSRIACGGRAGLDHLERVPSGSQAVRAGVEPGSRLAQRQVRLRRQDQREQPGAQVQVPVDQPEADLRRHQRDRHRRYQLEHHGGEESDAQRAQRLLHLGPQRFLPPQLLLHLLALTGEQRELHARLLEARLETMRKTGIVDDEIELFVYLR